MPDTHKDSRYFSLRQRVYSKRFDSIVGNLTLQGLLIFLTIKFLKFAYVYIYQRVSIISWYDNCHNWMWHISVPIIFSQRIMRITL